MKANQSKVELSKKAIKEIAKEKDAFAQEKAEEHSADSKMFADKAKLNNVRQAEAKQATNQQKIVDVMSDAEVAEAKAKPEYAGTKSYKISVPLFVWENEYKRTDKSPDYRINIPTLQGSFDKEPDVSAWTKTTKNGKEFMIINLTEEVIDKINKLFKHKQDCADDEAVGATGVSA